MKGFVLPLALLLGILAFSIWNSAAMTKDTDRWRNQLEEADRLAQSEDWTAAGEALSGSYRDWSQRQTYLHVVSQHEAVDQAEAMYLRCLAFARMEEASEFQAELSGLREQLRLLAEMEQFSLRNIL